MAICFFLITDIQAIPAFPLSQSGKVAIRLHAIPLSLEGERLGEGVQIQALAPSPRPSPSMERELSISLAGGMLIGIRAPAAPPQDEGFITTKKLYEHSMKIKPKFVLLHKWNSPISGEVHLFRETLTGR